MPIEPIRLARCGAGGALLVAMLGCGPTDAPERSPRSDTAESPAPAPSASGRIYERQIVFLGDDTDSTLVVPWLFSAEDRGSEVDRHVQGWLSRNGSWEAFFEEAWQGPPTRAPWRLLPRGPLRLVVGENDALERVIFEQGPRHLELGFGSLLVEWTHPGGQVFRVHSGSAVLASRTVDGVLLDINRARASGATHGEWVFLVSGDSVHVVVDAMRPGDVPLGSGSAWGRIDFRQLEWPELRMEWTESRAFERARRDVPVAWAFSAPDGSFTATIEAETTEIEAGEGSGPRLPVYALFEVVGELTVGGATVPVRGLLGHTQN